MAYLFSLWNLFRNAEGAFEFEVGQGDTFRVGRGGTEWVRGALQALGVDLPGALSHTVTAERSFYYSSYPEAPDWRDRWPRSWTVRVVPKEPAAPDHKNALFNIWEMYGEIDPESDDEEEDDSRYDQTALVIVDLRVDRARAETIVRGAVAGEWPECGAPLQVTIREFDERLCQARLFFQPIALPDEIPRLERLLGRFREAGGAVHWTERASWPEEARRDQIASDMDLSAMIEQLKKSMEKPPGE